MKYKEDGKKEMSVNLYSVMPETINTQHAKEVSNLQSEVPNPSLNASCVFVCQYQDETFVPSVLILSSPAGEV